MAAVESGLTGRAVFEAEYVKEESEREFESRFFIGVYSTKAHAEKAVSRLRGQVGFKDRPEGFRVEEVVVDQTDEILLFVPYAERKFEK